MLLNVDKRGASGGAIAWVCSETGGSGFDSR